MAWNYTKLYTFSTLGNNIEWEHSHRHGFTRSDGKGTSARSLVWDILWKLQVPSKVKNFAWKALYRIIPGLSILANRHIPASAQFLVCSRGQEDIKHSMFTCAGAEQVQIALGLMQVIDKATCVDRSIEFYSAIGTSASAEQQVTCSFLLGHVGLK